MAVHVLWSAPRSRSTAFFRSMVERGDLLALHQPLEGLHFIGPLQIDGHTFESPAELLAWLVEDGNGRIVFLKETVNPPVQGCVVDDRRLLAEARHAFLIRTAPRSSFPSSLMRCTGNQASAPSGHVRPDGTRTQPPAAASRPRPDGTAQGLATRPDVARFAEHHAPFYEELTSARLPQAVRSNLGPAPDRPETILEVPIARRQLP